MRPVIKTLALAISLVGLTASPVGAQTVAVTADRMLDVESARYVQDPVIMIVDGIKAAIRAATSTAAEALGQTGEVGRCGRVPGPI